MPHSAKSSDFVITLWEFRQTPAATPTVLNRRCNRKRAPQEEESTMSPERMQYAAKLRATHEDGRETARETAPSLMLLRRDSE